MAADRFLDTDGLRHLWEKIKAWIPFLSRKTQSIPFGQVDSTSTSTAFTATIDGIDELRDGVCCYLRNGVVASAAGFTININGLGAKPVYSTMADATALAKQFALAYTMLFIYNSTRISGGCWDMFFGYYSYTDAIGYQLKLGSTQLPALFKTYRYRLLFKSLDGTHFIGANESTSTSATTAKTPTKEVIDPFGEILYYGRSTAVNAEDLFLNSYLWQQYVFTLGYSFNNTGSALVLDYPCAVYLKCSSVTGGGVVIDSLEPYTQSLPQTDDGYLYIFLGIAVSETTVELHMKHPIYCFKDGGLRMWTNAAQPHIPEYTIEKLAFSEAGYASSYALKKDNVQVGATINIPLDMVVESGEVKTVTTADVPYQGAVVGDKYIDLTIANTAQNHIYIPVKDLVDVYVAGNGISISNNNYISVKVDQNNANGLGVGGSGLAMYTVTPSVNGVGGNNGAMTAADKEKLDGIEAGAGANHEYKIEKLSSPTNGYRDSYRLDKDSAAIVGSSTIDIPTEFTPLATKEYQDDTFYASSATWANATRLFMSVKPNADKEYWYVKYRVKVWIPTDTTDKRFTESIIEYFGSGISMRGYRIWNTLSATTYATYYQAAYWLKADGLANDFGHLLGTSILYATNYTNSAWYRYVKVDLLAYEGCTVELFDSLTKFTPYIESIGASSSTDYNTYSSYNATSNGLQETGDTTDTSNMYLPYAKFVVGAYGIMNRSLIMEDGNGKWQSFTTTSGTGASKTKNTSGFRLGSHIYHFGSTSDWSANSVLDTSLVRAFVPLFDLRYSLNINTTSGHANNLLPYKPVYIVGTLAKDGLFYLDDVWWTQTEPSTENGKIYIRVAEAVYSDYTNDRCYRADLLSSGHAYWYKDGCFRRYYDVDWKADAATTPTIIEVQDMTDIDSDIIDDLKAGDVVVLNDRSQKYCFITSFKSNGVCCMTYTDNEVIQTVVYTYSSVWAYDDTYTNEVFGNKVFLNGYTDTYGVFPYSLAAFAIAENSDAMTMTSFTTTGGTSAKAAVTTMWFPIGSKIYYYDNSTALSASTDFTSEMFYATHKNVDARYTAITGSNVSLGYMSYSAVFLRVDVNVDGYWRPYYNQIGGVGTNQENIVTIDDLVQGGYYIYLGRTVGTSGHAFQLEDNNPLYYYDGKTLQEWSKHIAQQYYVSVLTELDNYYTKSQTYSQSEVDALINGVSNFEYVVIESPNTLPTASSATMGKMYIYNGHRYVTVYSNNTYSWHDLGSYDIDLTDYVTETELQQALEDVVTTQDLTDYVTETELQRELDDYATLTYLNYYPTKLELNEELADRPIFQKVTEEEMQYMLDHNTWVNGVIYYTEED